MPLEWDADIKEKLGFVPERIDGDQTKPQRVRKTKGKYTGQKMELDYTDFPCPTCGAKMYKQPVCQGCSEGKKGFKIRLICEEDPDHEVLL